jgi:hypothetical protein
MLEIDNEFRLLVESQPAVFDHESNIFRDHEIIQWAA